MSETPFISVEKGSDQKSAYKNYARLFSSLPLFLKILPLSLISIVVASIAPSVFRWYGGLYVRPDPQYSWVPVSLGSLTLFAIVAIVSRILAWVFFELGGMWSTLGIYRQMVHALSRTRVTYFDENPSGRLLNRMTRDYDETRSTAIIFVGDVLNALVEVISVAGVAALASPLAALTIFPVLAVFVVIHLFRSDMLAHSKGLSAKAQSILLSRQSDLIDGREIFLLYRKEDQLIRRMATSLFKTSRASFVNAQLGVWASFWMRSSAEVFCALILFIVAISLQNGSLSTATAGVIISALFGMTGSVGWLDFAASSIASASSNVGRVFEIIDLPEETREETVIPRAIATSTLFSGGDIEFVDFTMSYRPDSPVIFEGLNLILKAGEKTALVGRTGSGKTSVLQSLMRMVYVHQGDIRIGGKSVYSADPMTIRKLFGVIPQAPYLFAGTLRENLDRSGQLTELVLQEALETVGLRYPLTHPILEGGQNLSTGERQLACIARVLAAKKEYILMDEPTSGLDPETDLKVGRVLEEAFQGKTLIAIAHRPQSIQGYDRTLTFRDGRVWEDSSSPTLRG